MSFTIEQLREAEAEYLAYRERKGFSKATVVTDRVKIDQFIRWLEKKENEKC